MDGESRVLHAGHQEVQQLADVVGRVKDPGVVGKLLQYLQTLRHTVTHSVIEINRRRVLSALMSAQIKQHDPEVLGGRSYVSVLVQLLNEGDACNQLCPDPMQERLRSHEEQLTSPEDHQHSLRVGVNDDHNACCLFVCLSVRFVFLIVLYSLDCRKSSYYHWY